MKQIDQRLREQGYRMIATADNLTRIYHQNAEGCDLLVITMDARGMFSSACCEYFRKIKEIVLESMEDRLESPRACWQVLFLYLSPTPEDARSIFSEHEAYWVWNSVYNRLMAYEKSSSLFDPLEHALDAPIIRQRLPIPFVTLAIILVNILIYAGLPFLTGASFPEVQRAGMLSWTSFFRDHQYYRIFTCMFLHGGLDHIFNNITVLLFIGSFIEMRWGHLRFTILYFSTGILAGLTSMIYNMIQDDSTLSLGASGAIFGLMGALVVLILTGISTGYRTSRWQIVFMILLSIYSGASTPDVDNAAHIGGMISGVILAALIHIITERRRREHSRP